MDRELNTAMVYRELGRTGLKVSAIALGCEGFSGKTAEECGRMIDFAAGNGVNFLDLYSPDPAMRSNLGAALRGKRDKFVIQGHLCTVWKDGQYERTRNILETEKSFEDLLKRLETDFIDVGMIHYVDAAQDFQEIFSGPLIEYAMKLKKSGHIHYLGVSSHNPEVARLAVESGLVDVLMFSINPAYDLQPPDEVVEKLWAEENRSREYCNFNPERENLYSLCASLGVGIDVMKVYAGGDLLSAERSLFGRAFTPVQALNYALTRPGVAAVMTGCRSVEEIKSALAWYSAAEEEKDYAGVLAGLERCSWQGKCMYCGHCAPCPRHISVAEVNKYLALALAHDEVPETVMEHYRLSASHASDCIKCGACEKRCPFGVPVREKMDRAVNVFGF